VAETNFTKLTDQELKAWSMDVWRTARQNSFVMNMSGEGINSVFQRIRELSRTKAGTKAVTNLVPDLEGDGVVGDYEMEGNEEEVKAYDQEIQVDQMRNANKLAGRMADQRSVVKFRETSRDVLGHWAADRIDQMASLTLAGMDYRFRTNGSLRPGFTHNGTTFSRDTGVAKPGQALADLEFAADVTAPTAGRHFRWDANAKELKEGDTTALTQDDTPSYAALVELKAHAKDRRIKSLRAGGTELYHIFMHPKAMAKLKLDQDFLANIRNAGQRGNSNPLFSGSVVTVDGLVLHEWTHSFTTIGAQTGSSTNAGTPGFRWGANADVAGNRIILAGAQALAHADISIPEWDERDHFDYGAKPGISISKILGFRKPFYYSPMDQSEEDFGVVALDVAM